MHVMSYIEDTKIKEKEYNKEDVLDESLVIANVRDMSRKELEKFADRMRIDRNSFLIQVEILETELYFCRRNRRVEEIVDGNSTNIHNTRRIEKNISSNG